MAQKSWPKSRTNVRFSGDFLKYVDSISPQILSVSRSTDIPAFYSDWLIERLHEGYSIWLNPMNQKPLVVNFENVKFIVFWTKNPVPLFKHLSRIDDMKINYYFQYSLNDYEKEGLEPHLPGLSERINSFKKLSQRIGKEKVIWRFDPLILSENISLDILIKKVKKVGNELHPYTEKLVISFIDITPYNAVRRNLDKCNYPTVREFKENEMRIFAEKLNHLNEDWGLKIATCGELIDLSEFGIEHNKCIDPELIKRICYSDLKFMKYLSDHPEKDKGQRANCGCIASKDIGMYNTCMHQCIYCYANRFISIVRKNYDNYLLSKNSPVLNGSSDWERQYLNEKSDQISLDKF